MYQVSKDKKSYRALPIEDDSDKISKLPPGLYKMKCIETFFGLKISLEVFENTEKYIEPLGNEKYNRIKREISKTFTPEINDLYSSMGYLNKKGVLITGKPGTGKTVLGYLIADSLATKSNVVSIIIEPTDINSLNTISDYIKVLRESDKDLKILVILDECEYLFHNYENRIVQLLDGYDSLNNFVFLGITNYPEKISPKFKNRPSRIALSEEIDFVPFQVAKSILENKIPEKYKQYIDISKIAYTYEEEKKTIDEMKGDILMKLEDIILK